MKIVPFNSNRIGVAVDGGVVDVTDLTATLPASVADQRINVLIEEWDDRREAIQAALKDRQPLPRAKVHVEAANPRPRQVFAMPGNFHQHLGELGDRAVNKAGRSAREQGFFLLASGSLAGPEDPIVLPHPSRRRFDHECELAVIIGRRARNVPRAEAENHVFGYAAFIDVTMRIEKGEHEEERTMRKSFASFSPLGPHIVTRDDVPVLEAERSALSVNGTERQSARLSDMIVSVPEAIEMISSVVELLPGDVIAMGTPAGVGPLESGDDVRIDITAVGSMALSVRASTETAPRPY